MIKGGYHMVDFGNNNLTTTNENGITISGIYESIESSYFKSLLFTGIVIEGVEMNDSFSTVTSGDNSYTVNIYGKTITITNTDNVKIA